MLKRNRSLLQVLVLGIAFPLAVAPRAQTSATSIDTAISRLAARIANPLQKVVKDPGNGLGLQAVESVRKWKFKPAAGPDGRPVAVTCPIEVTFRFF
jgi:hypothetical protein